MNQKCYRNCGEIHPQAGIRPPGEHQRISKSYKIISRKAAKSQSKENNLLFIS